MGWGWCWHHLCLFQAWENKHWVSRLTVVEPFWGRLEARFHFLPESLPAFPLQFKLLIQKLCGRLVVVSKSTTSRAALSDLNAIKIILASQDLLLTMQSWAEMYPSTVREVNGLRRILPKDCTVTDLSSMHPTLSIFHATGNLIHTQVGVFEHFIFVKLSERLS